MAGNSARSPFARRLNMEPTSDMLVDEQLSLSLYENDDSACAMEHSFAGSGISAPSEPTAVGILPMENSPRRFKIFESDNDLEPGVRQRQSNATATTPSKHLRIFHSLSSGCGSTENSLDDEYMQEFLNLDMLEPPPLPLTSGMGNLLSGRIKSEAAAATPTSSLSGARFPRTHTPPKRPISPNDNGGGGAFRRAESPLSDRKSCSPKRFRGAEYEKENPGTTSGGPFYTSARPVVGGGSVLYSPARPVLGSSVLYSPTRTAVGSVLYSPARPVLGSSVLYSPARPVVGDVHGLYSPARSVIGGGRPALRKSMSVNDAQIMSALTRSESVDLPDLIGDFSKPYALPLLAGRHRDLKSISSETLSRLLHGEFAASVGSYKIIDCRYPYEYEGGHILGAKNLYTQPQIVEEFLQSLPQRSSSSDATQQMPPPRSIVIFHCEFSSERGPKLSRFLRNRDRARNTSVYPALDYPELYLLHNGYKEFYESHAELCDPRAYRPMLAPAYNENYRHFRAKSKSWNADAAGSGGGGAPTTPKPTGNRLQKSRSRLML